MLLSVPHWYKCKPFYCLSIPCVFFHSSLDTSFLSLHPPPHCTFFLFTSSSFLPCRCILFLCFPLASLILSCISRHVPPTTNSEETACEGERGEKEHCSLTHTHTHTHTRVGSHSVLSQSALNSLTVKNERSSQVFKRISSGAKFLQL